ncbi:YegP family protein [Pseudarthrobacter sp. NamB4]|uniref:YegP family protein n=1 Tax=Pseudarthrobacter sp. NamB4 TaxID=2576837 RepID=UPI0010FE1FA6|nr:YegP family protein [Pseudarthrobacter sp. NamB4]TLM75058.1 DUF1508 domain-containing protein [Pseudarthrobacter sp. NamB4]
MAGRFEAFIDAESHFRFRLVAPDGAVVAVSGPYADKAALAAGISSVRECAGTGLVTDLCPAGVVTATVPALVQEQARAAVPTPAPARIDCDHARGPAAAHTFVLAKGARRQGTRSRSSTAAAR